jgi:hypothetical protein
MLISTGTSKQVRIAGASIPGRWHTFIFPPLPCRLNLGPTQLRTGDSFPKVKRPERAADLSVSSNFEIENVRTFAPYMFMTRSASTLTVLQISSKYFKGYQCQNTICYLWLVQEARCLAWVHNCLGAIDVFHYAVSATAFRETLKRVRQLKGILHPSVRICKRIFYPPHYYRS